jgi:hypothetical protein
MQSLDVIRHDALPLADSAGSRHEYPGAECRLAKFENGANIAPAAYG